MQFLLVTKKNHFICRHRWSIHTAGDGADWLSATVTKLIKCAWPVIACQSAGCPFCQQQNSEETCHKQGRRNREGTCLPSANFDHPRLIPGPIKNRQTQLTEKSNEDMKAHRFRTTTHDIWELDNYYTKSSIIIIFICACM